MTWPTDRFPTPDEINARLLELADKKDFKDLVTVSNLPNGAQASGKKMKVARLGKVPSGTDSRTRVVITGGIHAREWFPPRAVTEIIPLILDAYVAKKDLVIGTLKIEAARVKAIVEQLDIQLAPLINPDGYKWSQTKFNMWRKNRRAAPASVPTPCVQGDTSAASKGVGVDINRNFDILWPFDKFYVTGSNASASKNVCSDEFIGSKEFSENETKNVKSLLDKDPAYFCDCHMFGPRTVFFSWGTEENDAIASKTPVPTGTNRDGTIASTDPAFTGFKEKINSSDLTSAETIAKQMAKGATLASGNTYKTLQGALDTCIPGAADDFAFSKNLAAGKTPIRSFTVEAWEKFDFDFKNYPKGEQEIHGALLGFLVHAAGFTSLTSTAVTTPTPTPPPPTPTPSGGSDSGSGSTSGSTNAKDDDCFIATAVYGGADREPVRYLRDFRDRALPPSRAGRWLRGALLRTYYSFSPAVARRLRDRPGARTWTRRLVVAPAVATVRAMSAVASVAATPVGRSRLLTAQLLLLIGAAIAALIVAGAALIA